MYSLFLVGDKNKGETTNERREERGMNKLKRGTLIKAIRDLDPSGANVKEDTLGVVFEEENFYEAGCGPMVRWFPKGVCNVYPGDYTVEAE